VKGLSYTEAGVDTALYHRLLDRVRPLIEATQGPQVAAGVGPFAGLYELPGLGWLAASADGVGTKVKVAVAAGRHGDVGADLVNHCVNDIATAGARPLFLLDYFACGRLDAEVFPQVLAGLAAACQRAGCALLGGETAEMPGLYAPGDYDLAGFVVGLVEPGRLPDPARVGPGDLLLGLPSSGLHTNGYSLARKVFEGVALDSVLPGLDGPLAEVLLAPHRLYREELERLQGRWKTAAHITGGGLVENVPRALPEGLAAELQTSRWEVPAIFGVLQERGRISREQMFGTFNMGLGMVLVCPEPVEGLPVAGRVVEAGAGPRVVLKP